MKEGAAFLGCLVVAVGLHLWALPKGAASAAGSAGEGGQSEISVAASDGALAAMVATWRTPPVIAPAAIAAYAPSPPDDTLPRPPASAWMPPVTPLPSLPRPPDAVSRPFAPPVAPVPTVPERSPVPPPRAPQWTAQADPAPALRARGAGGGALAGPAAHAETSGEDGSQRSAMAAWGAQIRARIERRTGRVSGRGTVVLGLQVASDGALRSSAIVQSSGNTALDAAALQATRTAAPYPPAPAALPGSGASFRIALRFGR